MVEWVMPATSLFSAPEGNHRNISKRKQPECPSTDEWIKKMLYICTMEYYSAIKKNRNKIVPLAETWTDLETVIQSEVSQKEKNKYRILSLIYGI